MTNLVPIGNKIVPIRVDSGDFERECDGIIANLLRKRTATNISTILDKIRKIDAEAKRHAMGEIEDIVDMIKTLTPKSLENFGKELLQ